MPVGWRPSATASMVSCLIPFFRARGTCTAHSNWFVHSRETTSMTNSPIRGCSELPNRRYSPTFPRRSTSCGLRIKGMNGPFTPPRGPLMSSSLTLRCSSFSDAGGRGGMRSIRFMDLSFQEHVRSEDERARRGDEGNGKTELHRDERAHQERPGHLTQR